MVTAETAQELAGTLDMEQKEDNKAGMCEMSQGNVDRKNAVSIPQ